MKNRPYMFIRSVLFKFIIELFSHVSRIVQYCRSDESRSGMHSKRSCDLIRSYSLSLTRSFKNHGLSYLCLSLCISISKYEPVVLTVTRIGDYRRKFLASFLTSAYLCDSIIYTILAARYDRFQMKHTSDYRCDVPYPSTFLKKLKRIHIKENLRIINLFLKFLHDFIIRHAFF